MPAQPPSLPPKQEVFRALLEAPEPGGESPGVLVHLDPRRPGVVVPPAFQSSPQLVLKIVPRDALDLRFEGGAICCTLPFDGSPFACEVPWASIHALVSAADTRGMVWPEDVPAEVMAQLPPEALAQIRQVSRSVEKSETFQAMIDGPPAGTSYPVVSVYLDPRREGVVVPERFLRQHQLALTMGHRAIPPIPDLDYEGDVITCTLSFAGVPFHCTIPWTAIFALVCQGRQKIWSEDLPFELAARTQPAAPPPPAAPKLSIVRAALPPRPEPPQPEPPAPVPEKAAERGEPRPAPADGAAKGAPAAPAKKKRASRAKRKPGAKETPAADLSPPAAAPPSEAPAASPVPPEAPSDATPEVVPVPSPASPAVQPLAAGGPKGGGTKPGKKAVPAYLRVVK